MEKTVTYLADSRIHLPLYEHLIAACGNLGGIQVLSPESFLASRIPHPDQDQASILFEYASILRKAAREGKLEGNLFADSIADYDFLTACMHFLVMAKSAGIHEFPLESEKDRDLQVILNLLDAVPLWQQGIEKLDEEFDSVYIVSPFFSMSQQILASELMKRGARMPEGRLRTQTRYWTASNIRKAMELAASEIIEKEMAAEDVQIVLADPSDRYVLEQILETRKIPYTFLDTPSESKVIDQFRAAFRYLRNRDRDSLSRLLKVLYPKTTHDLRKWMDLFDSPVSLSDIPYEDNPVITPSQFEYLQSLEAQALVWKGVLEKMESWTMDSIGEIAREIQYQTPEPNRDDIEAMEGILSAWQSARRFIEREEDLDLFISWLDHFRPRTTVQEMKGVIIGSTDTLSAIRPVVFYLGADRTSYPGNVVQNGLFDERYLEKMNFPGLGERMDRQKELMDTWLNMAKSLYIITAQSDYEGKGIEAPAELALFAGFNPDLRQPEESSVWSRPEFALPEDTALSFFENEGKLQYRIHEIEVFRKCPLRHFLRFALRLHRPKRDGSFSESALFSWILETFLRQNASLQNIEEEDIRREIENAFALARQVFPGKKKEIDLIISECTQTFAALIGHLKYIQSHAMQFSLQDYLLDIDDDTGEFHIRGTASGGWNPSLTMYEAGDPLDPVRMPVPKGSLSLSLHDQPVERKRFSLSYRRNGPAEVSEIPAAKAEADYQGKYFSSSLKAHSLTKKDSLHGHIAARRSLRTYDGLQQDLVSSGKLLTRMLKEGKMLPEHEPNACKSCSYSAICRNASVERSHS